MYLTLPLYSSFVVSLTCMFRTVLNKLRASEKNCSWQLIAHNFSGIRRVLGAVMILFPNDLNFSYRHDILLAPQTFAPTLMPMLKLFAGKLFRRYHCRTGVRKRTPYVRYRARGYILICYQAEISYVRTRFN